MTDRLRFRIIIQFIQYSTKIFSSKRDYNNETTKTLAFYILLSFRAGNELTNRFNLSKKSSSFSQNSLTNTTWRVYYECNSTDLCVGKMWMWRESMKPFKWKFNFHECANLTKILIGRNILLRVFSRIGGQEGKAKINRKHWTAWKLVDALCSVTHSTFFSLFQIRVIAICLSLDIFLWLLPRQTF